MVNRLEGFWVRYLAFSVLFIGIFSLLFANVKCRGLAGLLFVAGPSLE